MSLVVLDRRTVKEVVASVDWGFTNPGVLLVWALDGDRRAYCVHQVYQTRRTIDWWIQRALALRDHFQIELFISDPSEPAYISQFNQAGLTTIAGFNRIAPGIGAVQERLAVAGDGRSQLYVMRDSLVERDGVLIEANKPCSVEDEFDSYVWPIGGNGKPNKEEPVKSDDHGMDALRYAVAYLDLKRRAPPVAPVSLTRRSPWR